MTIEIIQAADLRARNPRNVFLLAEERLGHYPEFREAVIRAFALTLADADGGAPGHFRAPSGREYQVVFLSRSGHRFPSGLEIHALLPGFDPLDEQAADEDLWRFLEWLVPRVGGEWTLDALRSTGKVYKIPWA